MKKLLLLLLSGLLFQSSVKACNAFFTHTYACAGDTIFFYAVDQFAVYTWDFGDTASGVANVSHDTDSYHVYTMPGTYYVTLFVNIGVEWDYRTQIISVGTDCFNSIFSYQCSGSDAFNFTNESTGNYLYSLWDFGDLASGTNDSSTAQNPSHTFSGTGNFSVTLITSDGSVSDTSIQTVSVDSTCLFAQFSNLLGGDCYQDSTHISVYYTGIPTSYLWDFGDPSSGGANTSTDSLGVHLFTAPGIYLVTLIISDGFQTDTFYNVQDIIDCSIWPANANADGEVNMEDLFAIGIYYGDSGVARQFPTTNWIGQSCPDWNTSGFNLMYLQDLLDKKYADCNGDGVINSLDLAVISQNYGLQQPAYFHNDQIQMMPFTVSDPVLMVNAPASWTGSLNVSIPIDLSATNSVQNVYGLAARIVYDPSYIVPGSVTIDYNHGWMGTNGVDLIGLVKDSYANGYIDFGIVRTDHQDISGNGTIAYLNFTLSQFNGLLNFNIFHVIKLISNGYGNQEVFLPVSKVHTQMNVISASIEETAADNISVYPNPVKNMLNINSKNETHIFNIILSDLEGRSIKEENIDRGVKTLSLQCDDVAAGIYLLTVNTSEGRFTERVEIRK